MIRVVHCGVPGRVRLRLAELKGHAHFARYLAAALQGQPGVRSVQVGITTGSLLVGYAQPLAHHLDVVRLVEKLARRHCQIHEDPQPASTPAHLPPRGNTPSIGSAEKAIGRRDQSHELQEKLIALFDRSLQRKDDPWHNLTPQACLRRLRSSLQGLSEEEAAARLSLHGPNDVPEAPRPSRWRLFARQFVSLPVALLGAVSAISLITGGLVDALIIGGVVVANALIGYITEKSSDDAIAALRQLEEPEARVIRSGRERSIPRRELVPGDRMVLRPGSSIPADGRLLQGDHLSVDESSLSGESLPVTKSAQVLPAEQVPLHERCNMVYRGTVVTGGSGLAVVTATGDRTQIGQLQRLLEKTEAPKAPIELQLASLGNRLVVLCLAICGVCFAIGMLRGYGLLAIVRLSLSLGAAAVPEGLPSAATTTFALAVSRMRWRGVLIRDLTAVESLGAIQILCVDKTGTLTENRMTVQEIVADGVSYDVQGNTVFLDGAPIDPLSHAQLRKILEIACLCSEVRLQEDPQGATQLLDGSPTELALIQLAESSGLAFHAVRRAFPTQWVCHRSESRPYMTSLHGGSPKDTWLAVKGSPEDVLASCDKEQKEDCVVALTPSQRRRILEENARLSAKGLRVLGFAYGSGNGADPATSTGWVWCGLVGMADPIKAGALEMVRALRRAGVQVVMLTGDQELTASSVAQALDLSGGRPLRLVNASSLNGFTVGDSDLETDDVHVFSRVSPSLKLQIVQMLRRSGKIVGMTGDGINDAPALKAADVGVCMGENGTRVAQNVANVILENDDLTLLVAALEEGRTIQDNIKKSVHFFLSSNLSEILVVSGALALGLPTPLNAMQLLWINLISDIFPGIALSMEPSQPDVLYRPPREAQAPLFRRDDFVHMSREAGVLAAGSLLASLYGLVQGASAAHAATMAFHALSCSQLAHAVVCRYENGVSSGRPLSANPALVAAVGGCLAAQMATSWIPSLRRFLRLTPMGLLDWIVVGLGAAGAAWINLQAKKTARAPLLLDTAGMADAVRAQQKPQRAQGLPRPVGYAGRGREDFAGMVELNENRQ